MRHERLVEQTRCFWNRHTELYARYPDQFVAFYDKRVLDHDDDVRALALRIEAQHGDLPIVIAQVTDTLVRSYKMISNRLSEKL